MLYYGNSLYSGSATSEDGVFLTMEVEKGVIKSIEARHDNGTVAMTTSMDEGSFVLYNEENYGKDHGIGFRVQNGGRGADGPDAYHLFPL